MSVTQTRCDDSFSVEASRMLQTNDRAWIRTEGERNSEELMYHTLGTHMKNGTGEGIQGDFVFGESLMPSHCDPFRQPGRNPISYSCDFAPS